MTAEETIEACGGKKKCGGEEPHFRYIIEGEAVIWRERSKPTLYARTVAPKRFLREDQAKALMR